MRKIILSCVLILCLGIAKAQVVSIPDANFKAALIASGVDINKNGKIEVDEALKIKLLNLIAKNITNLTGIKSFSNLTFLYIGRNNLNSLDVSGLTSLTLLSCDNNKLTTLDVSGLTSLTELYCNYNQLTTLDVSGLTSLTQLICSDNQLTTLNVSGLTSLTRLYCGPNKLTTLDVSGLTSLTQLICSDNQINSLNVAGLSSLTELYCSDNQLTSLNVSGCTALPRLICFNNKLTSLNVLGLTSLTELYCNDNQINSLNVAGLSSLTRLHCEYNQLTTLDVSGLTSLTQLSCGTNQLTSLNVSELKSLTQLYCTENQLTTLDVSGLSSLTDLYCGDNQLDSLNVSGATSLVKLYCYINKLTTLDASELTSLIELSCNYNNLQSLNIANENNSKILYFNSEYNPNLICVQVDDPVWSSANWISIDPQTIFYKEPCEDSNIKGLKVFNIDTQNTRRELKMVNLSIAADGSSSTVFEYQGLNKGNISLKFKGQQLISNPDFYGSFEPGVSDGNILKFVYNHPTFFSESKLDEYRNSQFRELTIQVKNNLTEDILKEYPIKIVRPSVLMVHGIWSNGEDGFGKMETRLLADKLYKPYQLLKLNYISNQHNEQSLSSYISYKNKLKKMALDNNISMGKMDVLGHSNGGLLSRYYIQNDYQYDINKLITFNTPHSGSQLANLLLDPEYNYLRVILNTIGNIKDGINGINVDNGVIEDLTVDGDFIYKLNNQFSTVVQYSNIGLHTITSQKLAVNVTGGWVGLISANLLGVDDADLFLQNTVFKRGQHDVVVSDESQIGGCNNTTPFTNQVHTGSTANTLIQNKAIELLNQSPKNPVYFSLNGYRPVTLSPPVFKNPNKFHNKNTSSETITILSPIEGASYNAGQEVNIVVNGSAGIEKIVTSMGSSNVTIQNHVDKNVTSANFNFTIPIDAIGRLEIVSAGYSSNGYENMASTFINVTTTAVLESLSVDDDNIYVSEGQKAPITILGHYDDGVVRDITNMMGLNYAFEKNNAEVTESGLVSGILEGEDVLTITYLGKTTTVPITIEKSDSLSNKDIELLTGIFAHPNPTKGMLYLKGDLTKLKTVDIYSLTGQHILEIKKGFNEINMETLQSGMYFLKINAMEASKTIKIIKE